MAYNWAIPYDLFWHCTALCETFVLLTSRIRKKLFAYFIVRLLQRKKNDGILRGRRFIHHRGGKFFSSFIFLRWNFSFNFSSKLVWLNYFTFYNRGKLFWLSWNYPSFKRNFFMEMHPILLCRKVKSHLINDTESRLWLEFYQFVVL